MLHKHTFRWCNLSVEFSSLFFLCTLKVNNFLANFTLNTTLKLHCSKSHGIFLSVSLFILMYGVYNQLKLFGRTKFFSRLLLLLIPTSCSALTIISLVIIQERESENTYTHTHRHSGREKEITNRMLGAPQTNF